MKCLTCNINEAQQHPMYGYMPCIDCQNRQSRFTKPNSQVEFVPDRIKTDRKAYAQDQLQPFRHGQFSKEYYDKWGTKGVDVSKEDIKGMKPTWPELTYYKHSK